MKTVTIELPEHLAEMLIGPWSLIPAENARHIREHIKAALPQKPAKTTKTNRKTR